MAGFRKMLGSGTVVAPLLRLTGTLTPATCLGDYYRCSDVNGKPSYVHERGGWRIWWFSTSSAWIINQACGSLTAPLAARINANVVGDYNAGSGMTGTGTVAEI